MLVIEKRRRWGHIPAARLGRGGVPVSVTGRNRDDLQSRGATVTLTVAKKVTTRPGRWSFIVGLTGT
jgi:hypothetical protein